MMKKAQRKYRATPRGKATKKKSDAAYYKAMKAMKAGARAMSQGDEAKNADNMAECLARNDYAGDPCGHRPGLALDDATVDPVVHFEQNYTAADTKGNRESDAHRADHTRRGASRKPTTGSGAELVCRLDVKSAN